MMYGNERGGVAQTQFERLCSVHGFAPSRALKDLLDAALGLERLEIAQLARRVLSSPGNAPGCEALVRALHSRGDLSDRAPLGFVRETADLAPPPEVRAP
jgi:hypothetical protein